MLIIILLRELHHIFRNPHQVIDLLGYLIDNMIEVVDFELAATFSSPAGTAIAQFFQEPCLLHQLICEAVKVLTPYFHAVLCLPICLLETIGVNIYMRDTQICPA